MKQCVVLFMVCVVIMAERPENKEQMKKLFKDCFEKTNPAKSDLEKMKSNNPMPTTPEGGCFIGCLLEGWELIDATGAYSQSNADDLDTKMSKHPKAKSENMEESLEKAKQVNAKCASIVPPNTDSCVTGSAIVKCLIEENKPKWFNFQG